MSFEIYLAVAIFIISTTIAIIIARAYRKEKGPSWIIHTNVMIANAKKKYPLINIKYNKREVENFSESKIVFWNNGKETIRRIDIPNKEPLRIIGNEECKIIGCSILETNRQSNNFEIRFDEKKNCVYITFEFIDDQQGAVIQIIHTGIKENSIELKGEIIGTKRITRWLKTFDKKGNIYIEKIKALLSTCAIFLVATISIIFAFVSLYVCITEINYSFGLYFLLLFPTSILYYYLGNMSIKMINIPPKGLNTYFK